MEAVWLWVWGSSPSAINGPSTSELNDLEKAMHATFIERGRHDLAKAFMSRHKYSRTLRSKVDPHYLWLRREAFLGAGAGPKPETEDEWIALALGWYGHDGGFERYKARLAVLKLGSKAAGTTGDGGNGSNDACVHDAGTE